MALKLRLDPQAKRDLADIRGYLIENAGTGTAERVRKHLRGRINLLPERPLIGVATSEPGIRILAPTRYPYRIYYTVTDDAIVILHIRHTARREPESGDFTR